MPIHLRRQVIRGVTIVGLQTWASGCFPIWWCWKRNKFDSSNMAMKKAILFFNVFMKYMCMYVCSWLINSLIDSWLFTLQLEYSVFSTCHSKHGITISWGKGKNGLTLVNTIIYNECCWSLYRPNLFRVMVLEFQEKKRCLQSLAFSQQSSSQLAYPKTLTQHKIPKFYCEIV